MYEGEEKAGGEGGYVHEGGRRGRGRGRGKRTSEDKQPPPKPSSLLGFNHPDRRRICYSLLYSIPYGEHDALSAPTQQVTMLSGCLAMDPGWRRTWGEGGFGLSRPTTPSGELQLLFLGPAAQSHSTPRSARVGTYTGGAEQSAESSLESPPRPRPGQAPGCLVICSPFSRLISLSLSVSFQYVPMLVLVDADMIRILQGEIGK